MVDYQILSEKRNSLASKRRFVRSLTRYSVYTGDEQPKDEGIPKDEQPKDEGIPSGEHDDSPLPPSEKRVAIDVHIQLVLPATEDALIYDRIFESLKRHLIN